MNELEQIKELIRTWDGKEHTSRPTLSKIADILGVDPFETVVIEFDGGTPCNIPSKGYGNGYGSFRINNGPPQRVNFERPMSNNAAELWTLRYAISQIEGWMGVGDPFSKRLIIRGDSQVALKWADVAAGNQVKGKQTPTPNSSGEMIDAIESLKSSLPHFRSVKTEWQPREKSVSSLGH